MLISLAAAKFAFGEIRSRQLPTRTLNHRISIGGLRLGRVTSIQKVQSQPSSADSMTESVTRHRVSNCSYTHKIHFLKRV
uniref:Uncharacterized protein n=1 Tax=Setaria viridis TaxID=4556 RepID=A0A4U6U7S3_SETVI|nr:hypothetical protein SEVIR_6G103300v2 [Setaria viridis]